MRLPCFSIASIVLLAGCGQSPTDGALFGEPDAAGQEGIPGQPLRPGLWTLSETIGEVDQATMRAREEAEIEEDGDRRGAERTVCLPADYSDRPPAMFWSGGNNVCTYDRFSAIDNELGAALSCNATPGTITTIVDGRYSQTAFDLAMTVTRSGTGSEDITIDGRLEGEWLGECPPEYEDAE